MMNILIEKDVMVPMHDGVRLRTDLYRPGGEEAVPILVMRYPYDPAMTEGQMPGNDPNVMLAQMGWAVVVQHSRGRFGSEGAFHAFQIEVEDGYDTIEWVASQPWSNGNVGMIGASYAGATQFAAAIAQPSHLRAITPASFSFSYFESVPYVARGVLGLSGALAWTGFMARDEATFRGITNPDPILMLLPTPVEMGKAMAGGAGSPAIIDFSMGYRKLLELLKHRPVRDIPAFRETAPWWAAWMDNHNPDDAYWQSFSTAANYEKILVPALYMTGWYDIFLRGQLDAFVTLRSRGATETVRRGQRLIIGPWGHGTPGEKEDGSLADLNVGQMQQQIGGEPLRFLEQWVKGTETGLLNETPIRLFVMGDNVWRDEVEWPLARTQWTSYYLHSQGHANTRDGDGSLSTDKPAAEPTDTYVYDPDHPVPERGGPVLTLMTVPGPGPFDQREIEARSDVLVYTSEVLSDDLEVTGPLSVELWCSSSAIDTDFTAKVVDVFPDGRAINLCQGIVRTRYATPGELILEPGTVYRFAIDLIATSNVFKPGHCIRLEISSSCFPTYDANPNTGYHLFDDVSGETQKADQRIYHDAAHPSRLILPIIPR